MTQLIKYPKFQLSYFFAVEFLHIFFFSFLIEKKSEMKKYNIYLYDKPFVRFQHTINDNNY
jgi:hypothetical protein